MDACTPIQKRQVKHVQGANNYKMINKKGTESSCNRLHLYDRTTYHKA